MKEASGELNMTIVTIIAIAAVLAFAVFFVPRMLNSVEDSWNDNSNTEIAGDGWSTGDLGDH